MIIHNLFYIIIFVTVIGSIFTIFSLFAGKILHSALPFWFAMSCMASYILPVIRPGLYLISPENQSWIDGYYTACMIWICGIFLFIAYDIIKVSLARRALRGYCPCNENRILTICGECAKLVGQNKTPAVFFGTLNDPACVTGIFQPKVILKESVIRQLSDRELTAILCHEIAHIKRSHILFRRIFDYVCILNWFNPLVWIARKNFDLSCETDCDRIVLFALKGKTTSGEYANTMLRLLELSAALPHKAARGMGALGYLSAKRRILAIMNRPTPLKKTLTALILAIFLVITLLLSITMSRGYFYPYPAHISEMREYALAWR